LELFKKTKLTPANQKLTQKVKLNCNLVNILSVKHITIVNIPSLSYQSVVPMFAFLRDTNLLFWKPRDAEAGSAANLPAAINNYCHAEIVMKSVLGTTKPNKGRQETTMRRQAKMKQSRHNKRTLHTDTFWKCPFTWNRCQSDTEITACKLK